jgi:hypothetical protein
VLAAAALAVALPAASPATARSPDPFTFGNPAFCAPKEPVEDFGLSELPPVHEVPQSGSLPFAPRTVSLQLAPTPVLPPGESFGFWLYSENYGGRTPLHWVLRSRIRVVDPSGQAGRVVAHSRERIRTISARDEVKSFLRPRRSPGFYRYEVEIAVFSGKRLAVYSRYLRVERRFWAAKLGLSGQEFHPAEQVLSRVENLGTETVNYGEAFGVQRYEDGRWASVPGVTQRVWALWLGVAGPGLAGRCSALQLPRDFPSGQYRIVKEVGPSSWPTGKQSHHLTAPFEVLD